MLKSVTITFSVIVFLTLYYKDAVKPTIQGKEENTLTKWPGILEPKG
jgi:hypothetical protein